MDVYTEELSAVALSNDIGIALDRVDERTDSAQSDVAEVLAGFISAWVTLKMLREDGALPVKYSLPEHYMTYAKLVGMILHRMDERE